MNNIVHIEKVLKSIRNQIKEYHQEQEHIGVLSGLSGISIFLFHYSEFLQDNEVANEATELIELSVEKLNNVYRLPTFCSGICGFAWTLDYLFKNDFLDIDVEEYLLQLDTYMYKTMLSDFKEGKYDYMHNALGYAFYFLKRFHNTEIEALKKQYEQTLSEVILSLEEISVSIQKNNIVWTSEVIGQDKPVVNFGLAHGLPSILSFFNKLYTIDKFKDVTKVNILKLSDFILNNKLEQSNKLGAIFPSYLYGTDYKNTVESRLAWCYGDLGIANVIWNSGKILNNELLKSEAIEIFKHSSQRRTFETTEVKDMYFCHGCFGIAHMYRNIYKETGIAEFKDSRDYWIKEGLNMYEKTVKENQNPKLSIIEGQAGVGLVLLSLLNDDIKSWDECLLLS